MAESLRNPDASLKVPQLLEKLRFAAGEDRVETLDAQALAESFLGDSIVSNILALGYAWQRGLVPVSLEALLRAIELNGVAVENNKLAFSLGRLAAARPQAVCQIAVRCAGGGYALGRTGSGTTRRSAGGARRARQARTSPPTRTRPTRAASAKWWHGRGSARRRSAPTASDAGRAPASPARWRKAC